MARAGLGLSLHDLAAAASVGVNTVSRFENGGNTETRTIQRLRAALEAAGATFLPADDHGEGVRVMRRT